MAISTNEIKIKYVIDDTDLRKATTSFDNLSKEEQDAINSMKKLNNELKNTGKEASDAGGKLKGAFNQAQGGVDNFQKGLGGLGNLIAGAFSIQAVMGFAQSVFKVTSEFEKMGAVLKNTLGSGAAASVALETIKDFAKTTPFSVQEITDNFIKLANRGIKPTTAQLTNLGDLASTLGKDMNQVVEAVLDVSNTERWNELGIKVKANGDKIIGTFKGVTVEVDRTEQGALKMIETFGKLEGVSGSMAAVSETLGGKVSNLGDAWDNFLNQIGTMLAPTLQAALELTSDFMDGMNKIFGIGKSDAKKNADLEVSAYKGAKDRISKLTDEQLQAELKKNNEKLKSINVITSEYDKSRKSLDKWNLAIKVGTLGVLDLTAAKGIEMLMSDKNIEASKKEKASLDGVNGAIKEELKLRADLKKNKDDASKAKKDAEEQAKADKKIYEQRLKQYELEKQILTLQAQIRRSKTGELGAEKVYAQQVYNLKKEYSNKNIGISDNEVKAAKLNVKLKAQQFEDAARQEKLTTKEAKIDISKINKEFDQQEEKRYQDAIDRAKKYLKEEVKATKMAEEEKQAIIQSSFQLGQTLLDGGFQLYQANLSNEMASLQKRYDEEIRLADGNQQKIDEINQRKEAQEKVLKEKAFKAERAAAIARVIFETASIIAKWSSNPTTIPLAVLTLANQAAQIGFIMAQPVPEFAEGTKGKPFKGGKAIVGERGVEKVVTESGKVYFTPPTATLLDLPKGSQVIPNHSLSKQELFLAGHYAGKSSSANPMVGELREIGSLLKSLPITQVSMDERGFEKFIRTPRRTTKILNNRFRSDSL